ncbi:unnamed protein product, partial [marine sediment metagenome]
MKKIQLIAVLAIAVLAGMVLEAAVTNTSADPGYTPITIRVPREGADVNKNAALTIVTERLPHVFGTGPAKITVTIET